MRRRLFLGLAAAVFASPALAAGKPEKKKAGGESYIEVPALVASTFQAGGRRGVLSVECGLDIPDEALRTRASSLLPRLRAAYAETVRIYAAGLPAGRPPDPDFLGRTLQRQTDAVLGRPGARLLLGAILVS